MIQAHEINAIRDKLSRKLERSTLSRTGGSMSMHGVPKELSLPKSLFEPRIVSLGPIHHRNPELQAMEGYKTRYADSFFKGSDATIEELITCVKNIELTLHQYYGGNLPNFSSDEFVMMMLIDGAFLLEFLLRIHLRQWETPDRMSQKKWTYLKYDVILLENQLPMLLLEELFSKAQLGTKYSGLSILDLILNFLVQSGFLLDKESVEQYQQQIQIFHILGILTLSKRLPYFDTLVITRPITSSAIPSFPTIEELHRHGVKFRKSSGGYYHVYFSNGILGIPALSIDENTERLFANMLAWEMQTGEDYSIKDYIAMMDSLVDGPEDIRILVKNGIIENFLKNDEAASNLINYLGRNIGIHNNSEFSNLVEHLNKYCASPSTRRSATFYDWKRNLKQNYIGNPWKLLSVIAAVILLVLTVIQTVCSILQVM